MQPSWRGVRPLLSPCREYKCSVFRVYSRGAIHPAQDQMTRETIAIPPRCIGFPISRSQPGV